MSDTLENGSNSRGNSPTLAMVLSQMSWGGSPTYPSYEGRNEVAVAEGGAAAASASGSSAAAVVDTGTSTPAAGSPPAGQTPASSTGAAAGNAAATSNEENLRVLRQNYEGLKPWEKVAQSIKDPAQALSAHTRITKMYNTGLELAKALGYTEASYKAAFEDDPVDVLGHLRSEHAKANPQAASQEQMRRAAEEAARKATEPITAQLNQQKTEAAMRTYDNEFERLVTDDALGFGKDTPKEVKDALYDILDMLVPEAVLLEVKNSGKVSGVQAAFDQAKGVLLSVVNSYNKMVDARGAAGGAGGQGGAGRAVARPNAAAAGAKPLTLEDIINDPVASLPGLRSGKY